VQGGVGAARSRFWIYRRSDDGIGEEGRARDMEDELT
jgi:hypothetical protein